MDAAAEVVDHPAHVAGEGFDLVGSFRRPEGGVEAAVGIVKRTGRWSDEVGLDAGGRSVHRVAVVKLHLNLDAVIDERIDVIVHLGRYGEDAALLLDPVP